jgi:two-component system sensor histidine kinase PhoQ
LQSAPEKDIQDTLHEQVARMNEIVSYQLQRAVATSSNLIRKSIAVRPVVEKLIAVITRVYEDKGVQIESAIMDCSFFGDERDLMELLGNVIDNACKYGKGRVKLEVGTPLDKEGGLIIVVEDDGDGIAAADKERVLRRGERLDTQEVGQGIGLAVVNEIVARYNGTIELNDSALGGAKVRVTLP